MASSLSTDVTADMLPALREWWAAIREVRHNPIVLLGRFHRGRGKRPRVVELVGWSGLLAVLSVVGHYAALRWFSAGGVQYATVIGIALGACACALLWLGSGLFDAASFALRLLGERGALDRGSLQFDETMHATQLTDRELVVGLVALVLPRIWLRWLLGPLVALAGWVLLNIALYDPDTAAQQAAAAGSNAGPDPHLLALPLLAARLPLTLALLYGVGLLAAIIMVLWLIALGRNAKVRWHIDLTAGSVALVQLAWVPLSLLRFADWRRSTDNVGGEYGWLERILALLIALALLTATLHFSRRRPHLRLLGAALLPPLLLALMPLVDHVLQGPRYIFIWLGLGGLWIGELSWAFSAFTLANLLCLPAPGLLGLDPWAYGMYAAFGARRLLLLVLLQLAAIAITAHAARLAVIDWRRAED